jgi:hypothetical protein
MFTVVSSASKNPPVVVNDQVNVQPASRLLPPPSVSGQLDSRGRILLPSNSWQTEEQRAALATYALPEPQVHDLANMISLLYSPCLFFIIISYLISWSII